MQPSQLFFPPAVLIDSVYGLFSAAWAKSAAAGQPSIVRAVVANSFWGLIWTGLLYAVSLGSQLVGPMMLQRIVAGLSCWSAEAGAAGRSGTCPTQQDLY